MAVALGPNRPDRALADMAAAQRRSALYGLDPATSEIPHLGEPRPAADALRHLSSPVLDRLLSHLTDTSLALVLADRDGKCRGGHLQPGTVVFMAEFEIRELSGAELKRSPDKETGLPSWRSGEY